LSEATRLEVYTDGQCPLCRWTRARVEPLDRGRRLEWLDYHDPGALARAAPHTHKQLGEQMHVRLPDGTWRRGYDAWLAVLAVLPGRRWLAAVLSAPPFAWLGPHAYKLIASRRYQLFGVPPPCDDSGVCAVHAKK
jgi:predicted DCC family thiol-disulfide oxidoreductase YuxK